MLRRVRSRHILRLLVCLAIAASLQIPIAWSWAYLFEPVGYYENSTCVAAPNSAADPPDRLLIENCHYEFVRWIRVTRFTSGSALERGMRSHPGEPYDSNPVHPLTIDQVISGISDAAAWPQLPPGTVVPGNIQFVQVEVQGVPFPCVYGRTTGPPGSPRLLLESLYWFRGLEWTSAARKCESLLLPLHPIWSGYFMNSLAWGLPLFALSFIPPALRRSLRRRRGLCSACAYDLCATPPGSPCPECGARPRTNLAD